MNVGRDQGDLSLGTHADQFNLALIAVKLYDLWPFMSVSLTLLICTMGTIHLSFYNLTMAQSWGEQMCVYGRLRGKMVLSRSCL